MKAGILCILSFFLASGAFVAWRVYAMRTHETPHYELVEDASASHWGGCESLVGMTEQVLQKNGAASDSTLTVLVLGDQSTANEPWRMGTYSIPTVRKVLEGRLGRMRHEQEILNDILRKCQRLRRTTTSPIFLGVTQAVADLRARGCAAESHCELFVDSDLAENVELSIRKMLSPNDSKRSISPTRVDNAGIDIVLCGIAVTDGRIYDVTTKGTRKSVRSDSERVYRIQEVWRSLFAEPAIVTFEPYCPNATEVGARSMPRKSANEPPVP
jgi:hypothetical protein